MLWLQFLFWKVQIIQRNLLIKLIVCQGNTPDGQFFQDLITMMAISMANACDKRQAKETRR